MIERAGPFSSGESVGIVFTGLRPGEKLHEESLTDPVRGEARPISRGIIRYEVARGGADLLDEIRDLHRALDVAPSGERRGMVRRALSRFIPEYMASATAPVASDVPV